MEQDSKSLFILQKKDIIFYMLAADRVLDPVSAKYKALKSMKTSNRN